MKYTVRFTAANIEGIQYDVDADNEGDAAAKFISWLNEDEWKIVPMTNKGEHSNLVFRTETIFGFEVLRRRGR